LTQIGRIRSVSGTSPDCFPATNIFSVIRQYDAAAIIEKSVIYGQPCVIDHADVQKNRADKPFTGA